MEIYAVFASPRMHGQRFEDYAGDLWCALKVLLPVMIKYEATSSCIEMVHFYAAPTRFPCSPPPEVELSIVTGLVSADLLRNSCENLALALERVFPRTRFSIDLTPPRSMDAQFAEDESLVFQRDAELPVSCETAMEIGSLALSRHNRERARCYPRRHKHVSSGQVGSASLHNAEELSPSLVTGNTTAMEAPSVTSNERVTISGLSEVVLPSVPIDWHDAHDGFANWQKGDPRDK